MMSPAVWTFFALLAGADADLDRFLADWSSRMEGLETLEVRFVQEKRLKILRRPLRSKGTIRLLVKEGRLRCTVLDPEGKVESEILVVPGTAKILYPALKRMEVYDLGSGAAPPMAFPGLGGDIEALKRDYHITLSRKEGGDELLLKPRSSTASVREMRLVLKDYQPRELVQIDARGDEVRLQIEEWKKNPQLRREDLELEVPPGTQEVRPLGKGAPKPDKSPDKSR